VARLQELSHQQAAAAAAGGGGPAGPAEGAAAAPSAPREPTQEESETISRTLLLAQRTADAAVADAQREADERRHAAADEASAIIEQAKADSRRAGEAERIRVEEEVQALMARRDFLESDVEQLEQHVSAQRERITEVVAELEAMTNRVPNGLAPMRRPQLSAADHSDDREAPTPGAADDLDEPDVAELIDLAVEERDDSAEIARIVPPDDAPDAAAAPSQRHTLFNADDR
jgi:hypothetical protein